jgi:hypothetical protein
MRVAALLIGLLAAMLAFVGLLLSPFASTLTANHLGASFVAIVMTLLAAGLAMGWPRIAAVTLLGCAAVLLWSLGWISLLIVPVYGVAALLAWLSRPSRDATHA